MTKIVLDQHQLIVQKALTQLATILQQRVSSKKTLSNKDIKQQSIYIYGDVGRGKSMLMKAFFLSITNTPKLEFHFNSFMRQIHEALRDIRKEPKKYKDELIEATKRVISLPGAPVKKGFFRRPKPVSATLICFDEFQVTDIADAMLLSRIFTYLFSEKIAVIFTSNAKPTDLYQNGLQRELFLNFVHNVLIKSCQILNLNSPTDYRSQYTQNLTERYIIESPANNQKIQDVIDKVIDAKHLKPTVLTVWGRQIIIKETYKEQVAVIYFEDLCHNNHSASDYQAICQKFSLIFLMDLPMMEASDVNEAKRFILFIDEVYENKTALIVKANINIDAIYATGKSSEAFKRTASRLKEIKSDSYWKASKINNTH